MREQVRGRTHRAGAGIRESVKYGGLTQTFVTSSGSRPAGDVRFILAMEGDGLNDKNADDAPMPRAIGNAQDERKKRLNSRRLSRLMDNQRESMVKRAALILRCDERAEDAVQEACLRVCRTSSGYDPSRNYVGDTDAGYLAWFVRVLTNICLEWRRSERRRPEVLASQMLMTPSQAESLEGYAPTMETFRQSPQPLETDADFRLMGYALEEAGEILDAWKFLPDKDRDILEKIYIEDQEEVDIAAQEGVSHGAVRTRLMNARDTFRGCISRARIENRLAQGLD